MAKYQHKSTGQVVEVRAGAEHEHWTPDNPGHDPEFAVKHPNLWQPKPWFQWAQWTQVHDSTPVTPPPAALVDAPSDDPKVEQGDDASKAKTGK